MVTLHTTIEGLQEAQGRNLRRIAMLQPGNLPGRVAQMVAAELQRYAVSITHVDTGAWRASHHIAGDFGRGRAEVYIDPAARNPKSNKRVLEYASEWEAKGGDMAVYKRTVVEQGQRVVRAALEMARREIANA